MEHCIIPYHTTEPIVSNRVLIIAPHADDEIFGCSAALNFYCKKNAETHVLILTDGAYGREGADRQQISNQRIEETKKACALFGQVNIIHWAIRDRELEFDLLLEQKIYELIRKLNVDVVYLPSGYEVHPDHLTAHIRGMHACARSLSNKSLDVVLYEVGALLSPNMLVDLTEIWPLKKQAMLTFKSQLMQQNYFRHIEGLNTYRTYTLPDNFLYAEAYQHIEGKKIYSAINHYPLYKISSIQKYISSNNISYVNIENKLNLLIKDVSIENPNHLPSATIYY
jgi:LmbE family N-acetylglucosaminyl deacetylase